MTTEEVAILARVLGTHQVRQGLDGGVLIATMAIELADKLSAHTQFDRVYYFNCLEDEISNWHKRRSASAAHRDSACESHPYWRDPPLPQHKEKSMAKLQVYVTNTSKDDAPTFGNLGIGDVFAWSSNGTATLLKVKHDACYDLKNCCFHSEINAHHKVMRAKKANLDVDF